MAAVQLMCARLGMVSGRGLAGGIRIRYSRYVLWAACLMLVVANTFNIGADLGGMGDAMQMVTGIPAYFWTPFFAIAITSLLTWTSYRFIAQTFKWLTLVLFAYVVTAFMVQFDWHLGDWPRPIERLEAFDAQPAGAMKVQAAALGAHVILIARPNET